MDRKLQMSSNIKYKPQKKKTRKEKKVEEEFIQYVGAVDNQQIF